MPSGKTLLLPLRFDKRYVGSGLWLFLLSLPWELPFELIYLILLLVMSAGVRNGISLTGRISTVPVLATGC